VAAPDALCDAGSNCSWRVRAAKALRADTNAPTLYLAATVNTGNLISRLRRIRYELAQMLTQVDEALARIETEGKA